MMNLNKTEITMPTAYLTNCRSKNKQNINFSTRSVIITSMHVLAYKTGKLFIRNIP